MGMTTIKGVIDITSEDNKLRIKTDDYKYDDNKYPTKLIISFKRDEYYDEKTIIVDDLLDCEADYVFDNITLLLETYSYRKPNIIDLFVLVDFYKKHKKLMEYYYTCWSMLQFVGLALNYRNTIIYETEFTNWEDLADDIIKRKYPKIKPTIDKTKFINILKNRLYEEPQKGTTIYYYLNKDLSNNIYAITLSRKDHNDEEEDD